MNHFVLFVLFVIVCFLILTGYFYNLIEFLCWKCFDLYNFIRARIKKEPRKLHLYGIWLICGLYGQGKTMALSEYLTRMRRKYKNNIVIMTNYGFKDEDYPIETWEDLLTEFDKPVIYGYDEIQNEFNSRDYKNFPYELVRLLTQNRKGSGKQIIGTAQRFVRVDKVIRELCSHVVECKTFFGRWTTTRKFDIVDYEERLNVTTVAQKRKIKGSKYVFIQSNKLRDSYDSFQMLQSAKGKEYISAYEKYGINNDL